MTGAELRAFRLARRLSQADVARGIGDSKANVSAIEAGHWGKIEKRCELANVAEKLAADRDGRPADRFEVVVRSSITGRIIQSPAADIADSAVTAEKIAMRP
jgi:transcriptional regulator with XRE-family HTH domain